MMRIFGMLSLCIFFYAEAFTLFTVQDLINSGRINECYRDGGMLQLSYQNLESLAGIENIPHPESIVFIDASYNQIKRLSISSLRQFPRLTQLWLHFNQLDDLCEFNAIDGIECVRELHLTHNSLRVLDLNDLNKFTMLYVLNLGFNNIEIIKPKLDDILPHLELLFLNDNKLTHIPSSAFCSCPHLQALYLHNNALAVLEPQCFKNLYTLRLLYLHNNVLTRLSSGIFSDLKNVHLLYLRNNAIKFLESDWDKGLDRLKILDFFWNTSNTSLLKKGFQ